MVLGFVVACTSIVELLILRRLRFEWFVVATVLIGTLINANYMAYTSILERNYDGPAHVLYIDEIAEHHRLPPVSLFCTACGHPPLYYVLAALWSKNVLAGGWIPRDLGLQWLSLLLFFGFIVSCLLLLRSTTDQRTTLRLAAAMVVFWPSSILNSVRVHNDALASTLIIASMYFVSRWDRQGRQRDFYLAATASSLALLTKSTGYAMAFTLLAIALLQLRATRFAQQGIRQCVAAMAILLTSAILASAFRESTSSLSICKRVLGNACDVPEAVFVGNRPINYLYFDVREFLHPTPSTMTPPKQDYFLNGLVKSSLFGTTPLGKDFSGARYETLATSMRCSLMAIMAVCITAWPCLRPVNWRKYRAILGASASMLILLVAFRHLLPSPFHEDFRHIYPVLVPFCLLYAKILERARRRSALAYYAGVVVALLLMASSVAFFVRAL